MLAVLFAALAAGALVLGGCAGGAADDGASPAEQAGPSAGDEAGEAADDGIELDPTRNLNEGSGLFAGFGAAPADAAAQAQPVAIEESGWWAKDGYVHYGLVLHNPNGALAARTTTVHVTLYDAQGAVAWEQDDTVSLVGPGAHTGFAGTAGDGWQPARVEFSIVEGSTTWEDGTGYEEPFPIEGFSEEDKLYFRYELSGQVSNNTGAYASTVDLCILLRGDDGTIVAGYTGAAYRVKIDRTKDFLVTMHSAPEHASAEVYTQPV